jgi:phosphoglycerate-specific signal transduction histidine kinase
MAELEALHAATRRLLDVDGREAIASVAVDAAVDVLDFPYSVVWYSTSADDTLEAGGVGLYLVRTLVERYGGRVRIEDNEPRGSVVILEFETVD